MKNPVPKSTKTIGKNLMRLRKHIGLSREEIAALLNVSYQQVQKYEQGINRFPIESLFLLQKFYNVPYEYFFSGLEQNKNARILPPDVALFSKLKTIKNKALKEKITKMVTIFIE